MPRGKSRRPRKLRLPPPVYSTLQVIDGALVWRVSGTRGPSPNQRRGAHWSQHKKDRDRWRTLLAIADGRHEARTEWSSPPEVVITISEWGPRRDRDNAIAANKRLIDALVHAHFIPEDNPDVVRDTPLEQPKERPPWVVGDGRTPAVELVVREA